MNESIDKKRADVSELQLSLPESLAFERFSSPSRKSTRLIENVNPEDFVDPRKQEYKFDLKEPTFVSYIEIELEGYTDYKEFEFSWNNLKDDKKQRSKSRVVGNKVNLHINDIIRKISVTPPTSWRTNTKIKSVHVYGLTLQEFDDACKQIGRLNELKSRIEAECDQIIASARDAQETLDGFEAEKQRILSETESVVSDNERAKSELSNTQEELDDLNDELTSKRSQESDLKSRIDTLDDSIDSKQKETQALNSKIQEYTKKEKELKDNINLFPTEITGFVEQGARSVARYTLFASIPIAILVIYTYALFNNAADLTTIYSTRENIDLLTMLMSRLPFALISIFIIHACYKLARVFVSEIMRINQQRLNLSKVSIVAKDVTDASVYELDEFSDDEVYELRTRLKMDMLKSHLKGYVSDDFEYDMDIGLLNRFMNRKKPRDSENADSSDEVES